MHKVQEKYELFKANEKESWRSRMIWHNSKGDPFNTGSFFKFIKETNPFNDNYVYNVKDYFTFIDRLSGEYVSWAKTKDSTYKDSEYEDMKESFKGFFGEYFYYRIAEDTTRVICYYGQKSEICTIRYMAPNLMKDFGVDFTAEINDEPVVIQAKFWNPYTNCKKFLGNNIFQSLGYGGAKMGCITIDEKSGKNMCFMWLGNEDDAYANINKNPLTKDCVYVFGQKCWDFSIDGKDKYFWENLWKNINNL